MAVPERIVRFLRADPLEIALDHAGGKLGLLISLQAQSGDSRDLAFEIGGKAANPRFDVADAEQRDEVDGGFKRDNARIVALAVDFQLARSFKMIRPSGRDDA